MARDTVACVAQTLMGGLQVSSSHSQYLTVRHFSHYAHPRAEWGGVGVAWLSQLVGKALASGSWRMAFEKNAHQLIHVGG